MADRLHRLWETHELQMEIAIGALSGVLLILLATLPFISHSPYIAAPDTPHTEEVSLSSETETSPTVPVGAFVTIPDESDEYALLQQELTRTTRQISVIQSSSVAITALIQKECGGQTNDCAKNLQTSLDENAREYDRAQERLKGLTAALGNLR